MIQAYAPAGPVDPHREHRQHRLRCAQVAERVRELAAHPPWRGPAAQSPREPRSHRPPCEAREPSTRRRQLPAPLGEDRTACVLEPQRLLALAAARVGGDRRPAARREHPALSAGQLALAREQQRVAVAREPAAEPFAQPGQPRPAAQQQPRRAERAPGEQDHARSHASPRHPLRVQQRPVEPGLLLVVGPRQHPLPRLEVLEVADLVAALPRRRDRDRLAARADRAAVLQRELAQEVEVERVLGALVAADVALARERARAAHPPVQVLALDPCAGLDAAGAGERDRDVRQVRLADPGPAHCLAELARLRHCRPSGRRGVVLVGQRRRREPGGDFAVALLELLEADRPVALLAMGIAVAERVARLLEHHVRVDQRAAAEPAAHDHLGVSERPCLVHAEQRAVRVPEAGGDLGGRARERAGRVGHAALEHEHAAVPVLLLHPPGCDGAAEARADHDRVEALHVTPQLDLHPEAGSTLLNLSNCGTHPRWRMSHLRRRRPGLRSPHASRR